MSGTVTDASTGETLPGVNIRVVGTQIGTTTDAQGVYEITVPSENSTLRFSFVGFQTQTINVEGRTSINVSMEPATLTGEEVVVVGYSEQRRADLTGSVQVVDTEQLERLPGGQISDKLQGNAAGVTVVSSGQPGQDPQIRIRGVNTFGNNTPLFIVDGVPTQNIGSLNPANIESMQVLKSASAASIYGARASNGVIIIETQQGEGDISVEVNSYAGFSHQPNMDNPYDMLDPQGRAELEWLAFNNSGTEPTDPQYGDGVEPQIPDFILPAGASEDEVNTDDYFVIPQYNSQIDPTTFNQYVRANKEGTDWMDQIFNPAATTKHDITVSGGGDIGSYLFSGGYLNSQGTLERTFLERFSLRANTTFNVSDNLTVGENLSYTVEDNKLSDVLEEGTAIGMAHRARTIVPVYDVRGNFAGSKGGGLGNPSNPVAIRERTRNNVQLGKRLFGNAFVDYSFLSDFSFRSSFGVDITSGYSESFQFPTYENSENNARNAHTELAYNNHQWTWSNTVNYNGTIAQDHNLSVLGGVEWQKENTRIENVEIADFFSFDPNFVNLENGTSVPLINDNSTRIITLASQFGKVDYNYQRRYFVSGTIRRDASSKFLRNRYGLFPAFSLAWRPIAEPYLDGVLPEWLSDLKFRGGWGVIGNQLNVEPNNAYSLFTSNQFSYAPDGSNTSLESGFYRSRIGAPGAKWERNVSVNVGVDVALFDGQIDATVDWYRKDIQDLLFQAGLLATAGQATPPFVNVGGMRNTGIDASVNGQTQIGDLQISGGINFTSYDNEITSVSGASDSFSEDPRRNGTLIRNEVGHPISSYYGYNIVGFWQSQAEIEQANANTPQDVSTYQTGASPGRFRYEDVNGDNQITPADRTFLGSPNPAFTTGLNLTLRYNQFDFSTSLYASQGAEIYNQVKWWTDFFSGFNGAKSKVALNDSWTPTNRDAAAPIQELERSFSTNQVANSYFVEDADYLRIRNVQLGYTLPSELSQQIGAENLRIYMQVTNLFTFTNYSNPSPEIAGDDANDVTSFGIDEGAYPTPREFIGGINLTF